MEKKDLRERLVDIMHYDGTYSTSDLVKFIQQELDRAREEGREEAGDLYTKGHKKWKATIQPATKDIGNMKPYTN